MDKAARKGGSQLLTANEYLKPQSLEEAYKLGNLPNSIYVSGGLMVAQLKLSNLERLVDLKPLGLDGVTEEENGIRIGANVKLSALMTDRTLSQMYGGFFREVAGDVGSTQIRNMATVGGSIAFKLGWSDVITMFMTVEASVEFYDGEIRELPIDEFISEKHRGAIITSVKIPKGDGVSVAFEKFSKSTFDIATLNVGVKLEFDGETVKKSVIVVGSRPMISERVPVVENFLNGKDAKNALEDAAMLIENSVKTGTDIRASSEYRRELAVALFKKAMRGVLK